MYMFHDMSDTNGKFAVQQEGRGRASGTITWWVLGKQTQA